MYCTHIMTVCSWPKEHSVLPIQTQQGKNRLSSYFKDGEIEKHVKWQTQSHTGNWAELGTESGCPAPQFKALTIRQPFFFPGPNTALPERQFPLSQNSPIQSQDFTKNCSSTSQVGSYSPHPEVGHSWKPHSMLPVSLLLVKLGVICPFV